MSTAKEELHKLVDEFSAEEAESALNLLMRKVDQTPTIDVPEHADVLRRHLRLIGDRIGLDVDRLPQNGYCSGGESEGVVEITKDWESGDGRHRLSKLTVRGHEIILLERMRAGSELRYEVRVFTKDSEGHAELNLPVR